MYRNAERLRPATPGRVIDMGTVGNVAAGVGLFIIVVALIDIFRITMGLKKNLSESDKKRADIKQEAIELRATIATALERECTKDQIARLMVSDARLKRLIEEGR